MALAISSSAYLPYLGPRSHAIERADIPPTTWIVPEPPASTKPAPSPKLAPNWESQPPPQAQWAKTGYVNAASNAVDRQMDVSRQRSAPALIGIVAARPTVNICMQSIR